MDGWVEGWQAREKNLTDQKGNEKKKEIVLNLDADERKTINNLPTHMKKSGGSQWGGGQEVLHLQGG